MPRTKKSAGPILTSLAALLKEVAADAPALLPVILKIVGLAAASKSKAAAPVKLKASGDVLNAITGLLHEISQDAPGVLDEVLAIVQALRTGSPATSS